MKKRSRFAHPLELPYYIFAVVVNLLLLVGIYFGGVLVEDLFNFVYGDDLIWFILGAVPLLLTTRLVIRVLVRSSGIRLSREQFPQITALAEDIARRLEIKRLPEIYLYTGDATAKTDAGSGFGRDYIFLNGEVCKLVEESPDGLAFLLAREFAHLKLNHYRIWNLLSVMYFSYIPILGPTLKRLRTYSCDRYGAAIVPDGIEGFLFLVAGRLMYQRVELGPYLEQSEERPSFWMRVVELSEEQPPYDRRLAELRRAGLFQGRSNGGET